MTPSTASYESLTIETGSILMTTVIYIIEIASQNKSEPLLYYLVHHSVINHPSIEWITPTNNIRTSPPSSTLAVAVDIGSNAGAVRIHEAEGGKFVDGVGTEEAGHVVIVPWDGNWYYYTIGRIRLGYIRRVDTSDS
ncbi:hypothetical protein I7I51_01998 [Histoplasma capsulatum]|uniref:Uncharacterized protein n=1 Tax=Ajellomyces capsulatus TaxID=5037 RepID=A0A8A1MJS8_AJECA|nr:hypothetical protein I7I51_01998 [Histoplasma capsulatum]